MTESRLNIWCNAKFPEAVHRLLTEGVAPDRLIMATATTSSNLVVGAPDSSATDADVMFGQPDPIDIVRAPKVRWIQVNSAGYQRYDTPEIREALRKQNSVFTNSSCVHSEPCAEHVVSFMYAQARQLPMCLESQRSTRGWPAKEARAASKPLKGQTVVIAGYGSIAKRVVELLAPLHMNVAAFRRSVKGDENTPTLPITEIDQHLPQADHVINILPGSPETENFFGADRFKKMKSSAVFYNIGRGTTVEQNALLKALESKKLAAAYLDVTSPEPLPPTHPLWTAPNCYITPHTAGGVADEFEQLVQHFLDNLNRFRKSEKLVDRVM